MKTLKAYRWLLAAAVTVALAGCSSPFGGSANSGGSITIRMNGDVVDSYGAGDLRGATGKAVWSFTNSTDEDGKYTLGGTDIYRFEYEVSAPGVAKRTVNSLGEYSWDSAKTYSVTVRVYRREGTRAGALATGPIPAHIEGGKYKGQEYTAQDLGLFVTAKKFTFAPGQEKNIDLLDVFSLMRINTEDTPIGYNASKGWYHRGDFRYLVKGAELVSLTLQIDPAFFTMMTTDHADDSSIKADFYRPDGVNRGYYLLWHEGMKWQDYATRVDGTWETRQPVIPRTSAEIERERAKIDKNVADWYCWFADAQAMQRDYTYYKADLGPTYLGQNSIDSSNWGNDTANYPRPVRAARVALPTDPDEQPPFTPWRWERGSSGPIGLRTGRYQVNAVLRYQGKVFEVNGETVDIYRNGLTWWTWEPGITEPGPQVIEVDESFTEGGTRLGRGSASSDGTTHFFVAPGLSLAGVVIGWNGATASTPLPLTIGTSITTAVGGDEVTIRYVGDADDGTKKYSYFLTARTPKIHPRKYSPWRLEDYYTTPDGDGPANYDETLEQEATAQTVAVPDPVLTFLFTWMEGTKERRHTVTTPVKFHDDGLGIRSEGNYAQSGAHMLLNRTGELAEPAVYEQPYTRFTPQYDIAICLDLSGSMIFDLKNPPSSGDDWPKTQRALVTGKWKGGDRGVTHLRKTSLYYTVAGILAMLDTYESQAGAENVNVSLAYFWGSAYIKPFASLDDARRFFTKEILPGWEFSLVNGVPDVRCVLAANDSGTTTRWEYLGDWTGYSDAQFKLRTIVKQFLGVPENSNTVTAAQQEAYQRELRIYFMSDGQPNQGGSAVNFSPNIPRPLPALPGGEKYWGDWVWTKFVQQYLRPAVPTEFSKRVKLYPVGLADAAQLAYNFATFYGDPVNDVFIGIPAANISTDLIDKLASTASSMTGDLDGPGGNGTARTCGADGVFIESVTLGGELYASDAERAVVSGVPCYEYQATQATRAAMPRKAIIGNDPVGSLTFLKDGTWSFRPRAGVELYHDFECGPYTVRFVDGDGDLFEREFILRFVYQPQFLPVN